MPFQHSLKGCGVGVDGVKNEPYLEQGPTNSPLHSNGDHECGM